MSTVSTIPRGALFGRFCKSLLVARGDPIAAAGYSMGQGAGWQEVTAALKAAIAPMSGAGNALTTPIALDFAEVLRPLTIVGRLTGIGRVPFNTRMLLAAGGTTAFWIGENAPRPVSAMDFNAAVTLGWATVASLSVVTQELARSSNPGVELVLANDVARAAAHAIDLAFVDPENAGVANVRPASITFGQTQIVSSGSGIANVDQDLRAALAVLNNANVDLGSAHWLMSPKVAVFLSTLRGTGGAQAYPLVTAKGGMLFGLNTLTSAALGDASSPTESSIVLVGASEVLLADDGQSRIEVSDEASIQMNDAPVAGAQQLVSLFQNGLAGVRANRAINWRTRRSGVSASIVQIQF